MEYDVFISHAHEDKDFVARPLTARLSELGVKVWLDEFELKLGDSLRRSVERGLSQSKFGVVVLSQNFFRKEWTKRELDALLSKEETAQKVILPIWHEITKEDVFKFSPLLADKLAASTAKGIDDVAQQILSVVKFVEKEEKEASLESVVAEIAVQPAPPVEIEFDSDSNSVIERILSIVTSWKFVVASLLFLLFATLFIDLYRFPDLNMNANFNKEAMANNNNIFRAANVSNNNINQTVPAASPAAVAKTDFLELVTMKNTSKVSVKDCRIDIKPYIYCEMTNGFKDAVVVGAEIEVRDIEKNVTSNQIPQSVIVSRPQIILAPETLADSTAEISGNPSETSLYRGEWFHYTTSSQISSGKVKVIKVMLKKDTLVKESPTPEPIKTPTPVPTKTPTPKPRTSPSGNKPSNNKRTFTGGSTVKP